MKKIPLNKKDATNPPRYTWRLLFSYKGSDVKLESKLRVQMIPPAGNPVTQLKDASGFWYEVLDNQENVLFRKAMHQPIKFYMETYGTSIEGPIRQEKIAHPKGVFEVLIPDLKTAVRIVFFSSPLDGGLRLAAASPIASFEL